MQYIQSGCNDKEKYKNIKKIFSSDLGRCSQTAKIVASVLKVPIEYSHELRERDFGRLNGKKNESIKKHLNLKDPDLIAPGGESFNDMKSRVISYVKNTCKNNKKDTILFVTHEGCTRALLSHAYNCKFNNSKCNTSSSFIFKFSIDKNDLKLIKIISLKI